MFIPFSLLEFTVGWVVRTLRVDGWTAIHSIIIFNRFQLQNRFTRFFVGRRFQTIYTYLV